MKANFLKRALAFCFDYFILTLVLSFITVGFNNVPTTVTIPINNARRYFWNFSGRSAALH